MTRLERGWPRPTRRVAVYAVLGLALYGAGANVAAGWVLVLAGVVLGAIPWAAVTARRAAGTVEVSRALPTSATAGLPVEIGVEVRSDTPASIVLRDALTGASGATGDARAGVGLAAVTPLRRGITTGGPVEATVTDVLGLFTVRATADVPSRCEALPPDGLPADATVAAVRGGPSVATERGEGVETLGTREHVPGDPLRHVHWRSVARRGELVVKQMAGGHAAPLTVAVDGGTWERDLLDAATTLASGIAASAAAQGRPVSIAADGEEVAWGPAARRHLAGLPPHAGADARPLRREIPDGAIVIAAGDDGLEIRGPDGTPLPHGSAVR